MKKKHEKLINEILNNPNISQELKDNMNNLKNEFEDKWTKEDDFISKNINAGKKVVSYDLETFLPIFEGGGDVITTNHPDKSGVFLYTQISHPGIKYVVLISGKAPYLCVESVFYLTTNRLVSKDKLRGNKFNVVEINF